MAGAPVMVVRAGRCCKEPDVGYTNIIEGSLAVGCRVYEPTILLVLNEFISLLKCGNWLFAVAVVVVWRAKNP